jgi:hypothetical protein
MVDVMLAISDIGATPKTLEALIFQKGINVVSRVRSFSTTLAREVVICAGSILLTVRSPVCAQRRPGSDSLFFRRQQNAR